MRILADENIEVFIVHWLRSQGHDVRWVVEEERGAADEWLVQAALDDNRVLLTRDRDFGELVFRHGAAAAGVVYLRLPGRRVPDRFETFRRAWPAIEPHAHGNFVVALPGRQRIRPLGGAAPDD